MPKMRRRTEETTVDREAYGINKWQREMNEMTKRVRRRKEEEMAAPKLLWGKEATTTTTKNRKKKLKQAVSDGNDRNGNDDD